MAASKPIRPMLSGISENIGLLANGTSGQWEVAIDETISGADRWFVQIEGASIGFYFEIPSLDIIGKMIQFFEGSSSSNLSNNSSRRNGSLSIGKDKHTPMTLIRDDEFCDRYFLVVGTPTRPFVRFSIAASDLAGITEALRQAYQDLDDDA